MIELFVLLLVFAVVIFTFSKKNMKKKEYEKIIEKAAKDNSKAIFKQ